MPHLRLTVLAALLLGVTIATAPAWQVLLLGDRPTVDELLALRCSASPGVPSSGPGRAAPFDGGAAAVEASVRTARGGRVR